MNTYKIQVTYISGNENYFHKGNVYEIDEFINICQSINADVVVDESIYANDEYEMVIKNGTDNSVYFKVIMPFDKGVARDIEDLINR